MRPDAAVVTPTIRDYRAGDEPAVLDLLRRHLGEGPSGDRTSRFLRWKHEENPHGRSLRLVAELEGRVVGFRALLRWRFRRGGATVRAARPVDTVTAADVQGRGIFTALTRQALRRLTGDVELLFNTPNERSLPGYLKLGWQRVGTMPVLVKVVSPGGFLLGSDPFVEERSLPEMRAPAASAVLDEAETGHLLDEDLGDRLATERDPGWLRWRYAAAPLDYRAVIRGPAVKPDGLAFFRVRPRGRRLEATLADVLTEPGDVRTAHRLIVDVADAAPVDHLAMSWPPSSTARRAATRAGAIRAPGGIVLVARTLDPATATPDRSSWAVRLGDLELF